MEYYDGWVLFCLFNKLLKFLKVLKKWMKDIDLVYDSDFYYFLYDGFKILINNDCVEIFS